MPRLTRLAVPTLALACLWSTPAMAADAPDPAASPAPAFDMAAFAVRHGQLTLHQGFGLATLVSLGATTGLGYWLADGGGSSGVLDAHLLMAGITTCLYLTTATLALTAPPPPLAAQTGPWDTVALHKDLAWLHAAGMTSTVALGLLTDYSSLQYTPFHAVAAYTTLSLMALSAGVVAFGE